MSWFLLHPSGHRYPIGPNGLTLGRATDNDVVLADEEVSRRHAVIQTQGEQIWLYDRDSFNGVFVNEQRLVAPYLLQHGDTIRLGQARLVVERTPAAAPAQVPSPVYANAAAPAVPKSPAPAASSQTWQAALIGGLLGLAGVMLVAFLVLRPLWNTGGQSVGGSTPGNSQDVYAPAVRAAAFLLAPIEESPNSIASTGVVLSEKGRILTAYAAVYDTTNHRPYNRKSQVLVGLSSDPTRSSGTLDHWYLARIVRADQQRDLAVLQIFAQQDGSPLPNSFSWTPLATDSTSGLRVGNSIAAISYPGASDSAPSTGAASSSLLALGQGQITGILPDAALGSERGWLQTSLNLSPGNLGALALDARGRLVGLYTGSADLRAIEIAEPLLKGTGS